MRIYKIDYMLSMSMNKYIFDNTKHGLRSQ